MAKKNDTISKPTAPVKRAATAAPKKKPAAKAAQAPTAKALTVEAPVATTLPAKAGASIAKKPAVKKPKAKAKPTVKPPTSAYTQEDVSLRAYFIAEKRRKQGLPGDEHQDWIEAERQLAAESSKGKKAKKVS